MMIKACDRCHEPFTFDDESVRDFLDAQYPGRDICPSCDHQIFLAAILAAEDVIKNQRPGTALIKLANMYGVNAAFKDAQ